MILSAASGVARDRMFTPQRRTCSTSASSVLLSINHLSRSRCVSPGHLEGGGFSEERARQLAKLLNQAAQPSNVPQFWSSRWDVSGPNLIVYVECDRPRDRAAPGIVGRIRLNGRVFECLDVLAGPLPGKPMWIGEPFGLVVRELSTE